MRLSLSDAVRLGLLAVAIGGGFYFYLSHRPMDVSELRTLIAGSPYGGAGFVAIHMIATLIFVPRFILVVAATLVFGAVPGFLYATLGATAAASLCFLAVRLLKPDRAPISAPARLRPLLERVENGGWQIPTLVLLVPGIPFTTKNYLLALLPVSFRNFSVATLLAHAPSTLVLVYFADAGLAMSEGAGLAAAIVPIMALLAGGLAYGVRKLR